MGPFEIAAIAIVGAFVTKVYGIWLRSRNQSSGRTKVPELERRIEALEAQQNVKALQERVHVLEEIVTTNEFDLQKKFRELESEERRER